MQRLVLATGNPGKRREMAPLLAPLGLEIVTQGELEIAGAEETGLSFVENALLKARHAARESGLPAIADDSGLAVDALNGAPGIYSARYAGADADDAANNRKLLAALEGLPEERRTARYHCLLVYLRHAEDPVPVIAEGHWEGRIAAAPQGSGGFGYDPLFYLPELGCTAAELPAEEKNRRSHRGRALSALIAQLRELPHA